MDWQRHYRHLAQLAVDEPGGLLPDVAPGVLGDGDDLRRWLERQKNPVTWKQLSTEQQDRLSKLGVHVVARVRQFAQPQRRGRRPKGLPHTQGVVREPSFRQI
ncbi:helicase associated domain-containing protein [Streptomyces flaveolus]|uniref:helicase associated domain-containing protein n=1 Tax=Streptomyces flaveolus TaxID=67297 RepID=UPI003411CC6B